MNKLFLDIEAINFYNKQEFIKSADWPISEIEFFTMANFLYSNYANILKNLDRYYYYIGIIELNFINSLIQIFQYNSIKRYAKKNNIKLIYSKTPYNLIYPDWKSLKYYYHDLSYPYNKLQRQIRRFIKAIYFNKTSNFKEFLKGFFFKNDNISLGSFDDIKKEFILKNKKFYIHYEWIDIINLGLKSIKCEINENYLEDKKKFFKNKKINKTISSMKKKLLMKNFIQDIDFKLIEEVWANRVGRIIEIQEGLQNLKMPKELLITEANNPFHKIIAAVFKEKNVNVINFSHGNDIALVYQKWTNFQLFSICNSYAFETKAIKNSFEEKKKGLPLFSKENVKYINVKENKNKKLHSLSKIKKNKTNNIMLLGYPYNTKRYTDDAYCYFNFRLRLEKQIIKVLKKTEYNVVYKAHPDRFKELGKVMTEKNVNVVSEKFENIWNQADILIFTYATTSTFGFAINCPIPIVLIDMDGTLWIKERRKILQKRVAFITNINNKNYKKINLKNITQAINIAKQRVNIQAIKGLTG